jgi:hypothetical protein
MRGAGPITDGEVVCSLKAIDFQRVFVDQTPYTIDPGFVPEYLDAFVSWITSSRINRVDGLDRFPFQRLTHGITQSLDNFILRNRARAIKYLPGEYPYAGQVAAGGSLLDGELQPKDALVLSAPFSATGTTHAQQDRLLRRASELKVPVLIDCAFFGICRNFFVDFSEYPCIETVAFSLSKAFSSGSFRSGIEFTRIDVDSVGIQNKWNYLPLLSAWAGLQLMGRFSPDYIFTKYRSAQEGVCETLRLIPSDTVIIGLGGDEYDDYSRDRTVNRCCIAVPIRRVFDETVTASADTIPAPFG